MTLPGLTYSFLSFRELNKNVSEAIKSLTTCDKKSDILFSPLLLTSWLISIYRHQQSFCLSWGTVSYLAFLEKLSGREMPQGCQICGYRSSEERKVPSFCLELQVSLTASKCMCRSSRVQPGQPPASRKVCLHSGSAAVIAAILFCLGEQCSLNCAYELMSLKVLKSPVVYGVLSPCSKNVTFSPLHTLPIARPAPVR